MALFDLYSDFEPGFLDAAPVDNATILTNLYREVFNREPDPEGFNFWLGALDSGNFSPEFVRDQFLASPEYADIQAKNAPAPSPTPVTVSPAPVQEEVVEEAPAFNKVAFVSDLYRNVLEREPDFDGLMFWTDAIDRGYSPEFVQNQFLTSPEYTELQAKKNPQATPAPAQTPLDPLFSDPRYIEAKQLAQEYGAYPVTIGDTVYNVLADGAVETIKPTDSTMQGQSLGAEIGLFSPTGETIVAPYFNADYGQQGVSDLLVNAALAGTIGTVLGPAAAGLLSAPVAAAVGSGLTAMGATGDLETAAKAAALAGLSAGAGEALGLTGGTTGTDFTAADAAQLAAQGIPEEQIVDILIQSGTPVSQAIDAAFTAVGGEAVKGSAAGTSTFPTLTAPSGLDQVQVTGGALSSISPLLESVSSVLPTVFLPTPAPTPAVVDQVQVQDSRVVPETTDVPATETLASLFPSLVTPEPAPAPLEQIPAITDQVVVQQPREPVQNTVLPVLQPLVTLPTLRPTPTPAPVPSPSPVPAPEPAPAPDRVTVEETRLPAPAPAPVVTDVVPGLLGSTVISPPAPAPTPAPSPAPATEQVQVEGTKETGGTTEKPDALTPVYVPPPVDIPIPKVDVKPELSSTDIQNIIKLVGGLLGGGAAGGSLMGGGVGGVGSLPPSDPRIASTTPQFGADYYAAVQRYYDAYMPETPRNVAGPLQQWYENKFGA